MSSRNRKVSDVISSRLFVELHDLTSGPPVIRGSLTVAPGHDYWWFLEFGTGPFHEPDMGTHDLLVGALNAPASVKSHDAEGAAYDIEALGDDHVLVYMTKAGLRQRRHSTIHPGIKPLAFVRTAIFEAELDLENRFIHLRAQKRKGNRRPTRKNLVDMVNYALELVLGALRMTTPDDEDIDPYHADHRPHTPPLRDAWGINKAK